MEGVVVGALNLVNQALVLLSGIGVIAVLLMYLWLKSRWGEIVRQQRWGDPWSDWAPSSKERFARLERERQVA